MKKYLPYLVIILVVLGVVDAGYLTWEHYTGQIPNCHTTGWFIDCGKVLTSKYAVIFGIPLSLIGLIFYIVEAFLVFLAVNKKGWAQMGLIISTFGGLGASLYFLYLMYLLQAICLYCLVSAIISFLLFILVNIIYSRERIRLVTIVLEQIYKYLAKPIFFRIDPEKIHVTMVYFGEIIGKFKLAQIFLSFFLQYKNSALSQEIAQIKFTNPVGLAAGFDYEARLTQILSSVNFGFQTVGTITHLPFKGNPKPMLGRLPKSKSLMVNKGFKNLGVDATIKKLTQYKFPIPVGISIGKTNLPVINNQNQAIQDIISTFVSFEKAKINHAFYELNISCPNLYGNVSFYPPKKLETLLIAIDKLKLIKPVFVKMPINKTNQEFLLMLKVISQHCPKGVIIGNLQTNRQDVSLDSDEVKKFPKGNFSGKPTYEKSNELIALTYKNFGKKLIIIGCGGIFSGRDAYQKIKLGASLVQLISGMIFEGPQLIAQINLQFIDLLHQDGLTHIHQAIGLDNKQRRKITR